MRVKSYYSWDLILYNCVFDLEYCESSDRLRFCDLCFCGWNLIKKCSVKKKSPNGLKMLFFKGPKAQNLEL